MPPLAIAGAIGSSIFRGISASKAAKTQSRAAMSAAQLEYQASQNALDFQKQQWQTTQQNMAPWLQAGQGAITNLAGLLGPGGELAQPWTQQFHAPTAVTEQNDPGYQFRLNEGLKALQNSAAARGGALTGATSKDLERYSQDYASNEYGNVYGRALGEYQQNYNIFQQNQANRFNRLAAISGAGQVSAGQLGSFGQAAAGNVGNILLGSSAYQGNMLQQAAAARASGYGAIGQGIFGGLGSLYQMGKDAPAGSWMNWLSGVRA